MHAPLQFSFKEVVTAIADQNKPAYESMATRPFLKWVGGKRSILSELTKRLPAQYGTYREPFIGGGALYFATQPGRAYLADVNFHLICAYKAVRDDVDTLIELLHGYEEKHNKDNFLKARKRLSTEKDSTKIAALLIYLNKTCFNGLYRVNKAGEFNVPIGDYDDPSLFEEDVLRNDSKQLQGVTIQQHSFFHTPIAREDFFYLDPPYHELYAQYSGGGFGEDEHKRLATFCQEIQTSGAFFMLSNSDTDFVRGLYRRFHIEEVSAARTVSCKAHQRGRKNELIIRNYQ
jgi:DNA adenine methylase